MKINSLQFLEKEKLLKQNIARLESEIAQLKRQLQPLE
jgi:hypothetical protein